MDSSKKTLVKLSIKIDLRGVYMEEYLWRLILFLIHTLILAVLFHVYWKRIFKNQLVNLLFLFIFMLRWINSNKFELIHLCENLKSTLTLSINV